MMQDDSYIESYISTIGVDFVSSMEFIENFILQDCYDICHGVLSSLGLFCSENTNCGARWEGD